METKSLFNFGIHNEASNIRAHVAVLASVLYVFPTVCGVRVMGQHRKLLAYQPGVSGATAAGHCVPPGAIDNIRRLKIDESRLVGFTEDLPTGAKGDRAVAIVEAYLKAGRFPLWIESEFVDNPVIQRAGTDLVVNAKWRIEVKCDFRASDLRGQPHERCTGSLYLQIAERNPLRKH